MTTKPPESNTKPEPLELSKHLTDLLLDAYELDAADLPDLTGDPSIEIPCERCLEDLVLVEADGSSGDCLCDNCEFDRSVEAGDFLYDCMKHGDL